ncbi:MAG TPA: PEP/pyruvate-binding domain-containing protein [Ktedonosporobacter sp.]|nr:PEP/pyruvate-binding domain-containing protein [Ktedonosporobacter sp.]
MRAIQESKRVAYIFYPDQIETSRQAGGKAAALASIHTAGLPVPAWFVVAPDAFATSLSSTQRASFAAACVRSDSAAIQAIITTIRLDERVCDGLAQALCMICPPGEAVAVRSSALDEDGALHSFAGQFDTFLFVPAEQVVEKVLAVWRSGFSERSLSYRREHRLAVALEPPAVLVQRMVDAEVAGVAFSADPVTGRRGVAVVSALYGLGTALVSGECDADTYTVDRSGCMLTRALATKKIAHRRSSARANGGCDIGLLAEGVEPIPIGPDMSERPALTDEQVRQIAALARRCEQHFGCPQDIEWCMAEGSLFLLQSRPITTLASQSDPDGRYALWDNSNIAESYNGITTPLTFSFARFAYEQVYRQMCSVLGIVREAIALHDDTFRHMIGLINGRVYYNLLSWYRVLSLMPGFRANRKFMEQMMGVKEGLPEGIVAELGKSTWSGRMRDQLRLLMTCATLVVRYCHLSQDIRHFYERVEQALQPGPIDPGQMRADELVDYYRSLESQLITHWDAPLVNDLFAMIFYGILRTLTVQWCGDEHGSLRNDLLTGEGGIISVEPARRVHSMAAMAASNEVFVELLCNGSRSAIQQAMEALPTFAAEYQSYLELFADRCLEELKLESATLRDDPLPLLRSIGQLARRVSVEANTLCPQTNEASMSVRQRAEQRVEQELRHHPVRRLLFGWVLQQTRMRVRDRENLRFERTRVFGRVRRIFSELGRRFHALDLLQEPQDIFYLEVEEALGFVSGRATTTNLKGLISLRKAEYARFKTLGELSGAASPADRFETRGIVNHGHTFQSAGADAPASSDDTADSTAEARQGTGCCPGVVRGPVRIITDPKGAEIHSGEILVARRTDPGWIMLFPVAAGIIVEHGSLLSHSAIVAREMGIPTIVGLSNATRWLRTGDQVELDGSRGLVRKISPADCVGITTHDTSTKEVAHG